MTLAGRTWFVTGASAGFGREIVREVVARGGNAVAAARNPRDVDDLVALAPDRVLAATLDVTSREQIDAAVAEALARFGKVDVLVNNAGYGFLSTIEEASDDQISHQFAVNLFGPIALMRALLPGMRARRDGMVVNVSSVAGAVGFPGSGYYSATKAALEALSEALAGEAGALGIGCMIVAPGPFRTEFFGRSIQRPAHPIDDYAEMAERRNGYIATQGQQRGDPMRGARMIVDAVTGGNPPMRLILGGGAYDVVSSALRGKLDAIASEEATAPLADFPEGE